MVNYGRKRAITVKNGQLRSKTVNYGEKQSITVKNGQLRSKTVNYCQKTVNYGQNLSITVKNGQLGMGVDQWEAFNWSCDLRANEKLWRTDWINYEGDCRTAPATPGLLII